MTQGLKAQLDQKIEILKRMQGEMKMELKVKFSTEIENPMRKLKGKILQVEWIMNK